MPARFTSLMTGHYPATAVPAQPDLAALAGAALDELADAVGAEVGALWGAREEGGELVLLAARGLARDAVPQTRDGRRGARRPRGRRVARGDRDTRRRTACRWSA